MRELQDGYIIYKCKICNRGFILFTNEVKHSEEESSFITCPYHGKHKNIIVVGKYENIKECMDHDSFMRKGGRIKQR